MIMCIFGTELWSLKACGQVLKHLFYRKLVKTFESNGEGVFAY